MRLLVAIVPFTVGVLACTDRSKPKETSTTSASVDSPLPATSASVASAVPAGFERHTNDEGGYSIDLPTGSRVVPGSDNAGNDETFEVHGVAPRSVNVLVVGRLQYGAAVITPGKVAQIATIDGRALVEKGSLPSGAFAVTEPSPTEPPADRGPERCIDVQRASKANAVHAICCGRKRDAPLMDEICRSLRVTN